MANRRRRARNGTEMARPISTTAAPAWGATVPARALGEARPGRPEPRWQEPGGLATSRVINGLVAGRSDARSTDLRHERDRDAPLSHRDRPCAGRPAAGGDGPAVPRRRTLPVLPARAGHSRWHQGADLVGHGGRRPQRRRRLVGQRPQPRPSRSPGLGSGPRTTRPQLGSPAKAGRRRGWGDGRATSAAGDPRGAWSAAV